MKDTFKIFLKQYEDALQNQIDLDLLLKAADLINIAKEKNGKLIFAGNGGSAAMASHVAVDFTKNAGIKSINFNEADLITCLANDYGYEYWMSKSIEIYGDQGDQVILISSSGNSENVLNASNVAKDKGCKVITFSGFDEQNPLKLSGDLNFWVDSRAYNVVEMIHHIWLLAVCDAIIGKAEYPAS